MVEKEKIKKDIKNLGIEEITMFFSEHNIPRYRAKQVYEWLWKKRVANFDEMTSLSISDRKLLKNNFTINNVRIHKSEKSDDNESKNGMRGKRAGGF